MSKLNEAVGVFKDATRPSAERAAAYLEADALRKSAKTSWSKLGAPDAAETYTSLMLGEGSPLDEDGGAINELIPGLHDRDPLDISPDEELLVDKDPPADGELVHVLEDEADALDGVEPGWYYFLGGMGHGPFETDDLAKAAYAVAVAPAEEPKPAKVHDPDRGALTRSVESLLMDPDLSYADIVAVVHERHPGSNTTARSIASVAAVMRTKGHDVPIRRKAAAVKPPKAQEVTATAETE